MSDEATAQEAPFSPRPAGWRGLALLLLLTLAVRSFVLWGMRDNFDKDPDAYRSLAENLLTYGEFALHIDQDKPIPTAFRPPLYPLVLSKVAAGDEQIPPLAVALLHLVLGVATVWLVRWLGLRWGLGGWTWLAAGLVACDPILLHQSTFIMTETLATFLAALGLVCWTRYAHCRCWWTAALSGGALGLAILCRPTFAVSLAAGALVVPWIPRRWPSRIAHPLVYAFTAALVLSPWAVRNYRVFGKPIFATTHGGYTFALGNNPYYYEHIFGEESGRPWDSSEFQLQMELKQMKFSYQDRWLQRNEITDTGDELERDRFYYQETLKFINERPTEFFRACLHRIGQLWSPLPKASYEAESTSRRLLRYATGIWYVLVFLLAALGVGSLGRGLLRSPWVWGVVLIVSFTLVHTFYWSNMRMRAPIVPVISLLAALGASRASSLLARRKTFS